MKGTLPTEILTKYKELEPQIKQRLKDFSNVKETEYFYELCFCLCTPQSKAENALKVQNILKEKSFFEKPFNPSEILRNPEHYIRFHNHKAEYIITAREHFQEIKRVLNSKLQPHEKRNLLAFEVKGMGMKEASHFLRNIGYRSLAILDRHILKHLVLCGIFPEIPKISSVKQYLAVESAFLEFSKQCKIPIDELDLLFWSYETGKILK
jgi:N-glycosylase/DNA lyase